MKNCNEFICYSGIATLLLIPFYSFGLEPEWVTETDFQACFYEAIEIPGDSIAVAGSFEGRPCLFMYEIGGDTLWTCLPDSLETSTGALAWVDDVPEGFITCGSLVPEGNDKRCLVALIDRSGNIVWKRTYDLAVGEQDAARCILRSSTGDYYFTGYADPSGNHLVVATVRLSSSGDIIWSDFWGNINTCRGINIVENPYGEFAVIAQSGRPSLIVYTELGNIVLCRYYTTITVTPPSGLAVNSTGYCFATKYYCKICKLDLFGVPLWIHGFSGVTGENYFMGLKETGDGGYIAAGWLSEFYPGETMATHDGWIVRISSEGALEWNHRYIDGTRSSVEFMGVIEYSSGGYLAIGSIAGHGLQVFYPPEEGIEAIPAELPITFSCSPCPFSYQVNISYELLEPSDVNISIYDTVGRCLESMHYSFVPQGEHSVVWEPGRSLSNGCYIVQIELQGVSLSKRIILLR